MSGSLMLTSLIVLLDIAWGSKPFTVQSLQQDKEKTVNPWPRDHVCIGPFATPTVAQKWLTFLLSMPEGPPLILGRKDSYPK
jgi:hypothetical protein